MAGRKRKLSPAEEIEKLGNEIMDLEEQITAKKARIEEIQDGINEEKKDKVMKAIQASGKSLDEVLEMLK